VENLVTPKNYTDVPWISVVLVAHNGDAKYLLRSLASLKAQTLDPSQFELIISWDGKADETANNYLVDACQGAKFPIQILESDDNTGYYTVPRNRAMPLTRGFYIYNMDADNEIAPAHLAILLDEIRKPHEEQGWPHFVYSRRRIIKDPEAYKQKEIREGDSPLREWTPENIAALQQSPQNNFVDTGDMLVGRSVLYELAERTGMVWNTEMRRFADWELVRRMSLNGMRGRAVDAITNLYHVTGGNVSFRSMADLVAIPVEMYDQFKAEGKIIA
jgi:glycosyltransferase involved in cell wall biosynthesis